MAIRFIVTAIVAGVLFGAMGSFAAVQPKPLEYKHGEAILEGQLAFSKKGPKKKPAVIIIHNWDGIDDYEKMRTKKIAELGYVAFAADIYGKGVRPKGEEAKTLSSSYKNNVKLLRERIQAAFDTVAKLPNVDPKRIVVMGYCFGGTGALEFARSGADIVGAISFHGGLSTPDPADAKNIKGKVLALHGADDPFVSERELRGFEKEMRDAQVDWQMISYGGAVHSFTEVGLHQDNSKGAAYNPKADKRSWEAMKQFLAEAFKK